VKLHIIMRFAPSFPPMEGRGKKARMLDDKEQSRYFQGIARRFLARRGAPFFLSAKDLDLISSWEQAGIPLPVVLEGIEKAFENHRKGRRERGKILSISFCRAQVRQAFEQCRDRKVGGTQKTAERREKRVLLRSEIDRFLKRPLPGLEFLRDIFLEAQEKLGRPDSPDEVLERLDEETERLLLANADAEERAAVEKEILAEHQRLGREELAAAVEIKLVKYLRDKHRVPYLSPFYY